MTHLHTAYGVTAECIQPPEAAIHGGPEPGCQYPDSHHPHPDVKRRLDEALREAMKGSGGPRVFRVDGILSDDVWTLRRGDRLLLTEDGLIAAVVATEELF